VRKVILILVITIFGLADRSMAQVDPHFSQYYAYPLWLNPALTGVIDGDVRVNANYKNQWPTINNAYQTGALSVDFRPTEKVGIGFNMINQSAGAVGYNYLAAYGSFGYAIMFDADGYHQLHFGVQAGLINRSFDESKLQLDDQYNPTSGFDPTLPSFENFSSTGATIFDAGAGVYYFNGDPESPANVFGGFSVAHLTQPKDPFATEGINSTLPMRYTLHGGVKINVSEGFDFTPHVIYIRQGDNQIRALGIYSEFKSNEDDAFIIGGMYRYQDAAVVNVGYRLNNMILGLSYDFNTSQLNTATAGQGGIELSLSYVFHKTSHDPAQVCPRF